MGNSQQVLTVATAINYRINSLIKKYLVLQTKREKLSKNEEDDFVPVITMNHSRYEPAQIYWDQDGNLRYGILKYWFIEW